MYIKAEKFAQGGQVVAHLENGKIVFINGLFPNEEAEIEIIEEKKDYCIAKVLYIAKKSEFRRNSLCPYSESCGGCQWLEYSYQGQKNAKEEMLKELFSDMDYKYEEAVFGPEFGYRSRSRFQYKIEKGKASLGFCAENSNSKVLIKTCPVVDDQINSIIKNPPRLNAWELKNQELSCITTDKGVLYDDSISCITILNKRLPVSNKVFFQSNLILLPRMIEYILSLIQGPSVMDLYSGIGTFSAFLEDYYNVTAVEINKYCLSLARKHLKKTEFFTSPVEKYKCKKASVNTVIVDPPRVGLEKNVPSMIASWNCERIIYVSCYAPTMHRDIKRFETLGYKLKSLKLFDFYPQTPHMETVCLLSRMNNRKPDSYVKITLDMEEYYNIINKEQDKNN